MRPAFSPYPGFDPCDGDDPRVTLSRDNPCRPMPAFLDDGEGTTWTDALANSPCLNVSDFASHRDDRRPASGPCDLSHSSGDTRG